MFIAYGINIKNLYIRAPYPYEATERVYNYRLNKYSQAHQKKNTLYG